MADFFEKGQAGHVHSRNSSADLSKIFRNEIGMLFGGQGGPAPWVDPLRVLLVTGHQNCLAVAYKHFVAVYKLRESSGFQLAFSTPYLEQVFMNMNQLQ